LAEDKYQEIKRLREALEFYAEPKGWRADGTFTRADESGKHPDCGTRAQAALKQ